MKILVDVQGRICLPAKVRRDLGIESGNYVEVNFDSNLSSIVISKPKKSCVLCGKEVKNSDGYFYKIVDKDEKYLCSSCSESLNMVTPKKE